MDLNANLTRVLMETTPDTELPMVEKLMPLWWYLGIQAIIGLIGIEFAFYKFTRYMENDEARDSNFPAFRRYDAPHFRRWKFYPGALLFMPTRMALLLVEGLILLIFLL